MTIAPNSTNQLKFNQPHATIILYEVRCPCCGKLVCEANGIVRKRCDRCKNLFVVDTSKPRASE